MVIVPEEYQWSMPPIVCWWYPKIYFGNQSMIESSGSKLFKTELLPSSNTSTFYYAVYDIPLVNQI